MLVFTCGLFHLQPPFFGTATAAAFSPPLPSPRPPPPPLPPPPPSPPPPPPPPMTNPTYSSSYHRHHHHHCYHWHNYLRDALLPCVRYNIFDEAIAEVLHVMEVNFKADFERTMEFRSLSKAVEREARELQVLRQVRK